MRTQTVFLRAQLTNHEAVNDSFPIPAVTQSKIEVTMDLRPRVTKLVKAAKLSVSERRELTRLLMAVGQATESLRAAGHEFQANSLKTLCLNIDDLLALGLMENKA